MPSESLQDLDDEALTRLWGQTMSELRRRGIVRTFNNPVADIAERLAARHLGLTLVTANSVKGHDALDDDGRRYQIKSRRVTPENASRQLGSIRDLSRQPFDFLVAVFFDEALTLTDMWVLSPDVVRDYARYSKHVRGHLLRMRGPVLEDPRTRRVYPPAGE